MSVKHRSCVLSAFALLGVLLGTGSCSEGSIAYVRKVENSTSSGFKNLSVTFPSNTTEGNFLVAVTTAYYASGSVNMVMQALPNAVWQTAGAVVSNNSCQDAENPGERTRYVVIWYLHVTADVVGTTYTCVFDGAPAVSFIVAEFSGVTQKDKGNTNRNSGTGLSTNATGTLSTTDQLVVVAYGQIGSGGFSSASGVTTKISELSDSAGTQTGAMYYDITTTTASRTGSVTSATSACWGGVIATFK